MSSNKIPNLISSIESYSMQISFNGSVNNVKIRRYPNSDSITFYKKGDEDKTLYSALSNRENILEDDDCVVVFDDRDISGKWTMTFNIGTGLGSYLNSSGDFIIKFTKDVELLASGCYFETAEEAHAVLQTLISQDEPMTESSTQV
jgi:hypothetical protein